jgi:hypothetical protein
MHPTGSEEGGPMGLPTPSGFGYMLRSLMQPPVANALGERPMEPLLFPGNGKGHSYCARPLGCS